MLKPDTLAPLTDIERTDALRNVLRARIDAGDIESVTAIAKDAYAHAVRMRNELRPYELDFNVATEVLLAFLIDSQRKAVNDSEFDIALAPAKSTPVTNEAALYDMLHALRIDGAPLPAELLREAARIDEPAPPLPVKKTNLTKIKALAATYGRDVQACIDTCVDYVPARRVLIFRPKESPDTHGKQDTGTRRLTG